MNMLSLVALLVKGVQIINGNVAIQGDLCVESPDETRLLDISESSKQIQMQADLIVLMPPTEGPGCSLRLDAENLQTQIIAGDSNIQLANGVTRFYSNSPNFGFIFYGSVQIMGGLQLYGDLDGTYSNAVFASVKAQTISPASGSASVGLTNNISMSGVQLIANMNGNINLTGSQINVSAGGATVFADSNAIALAGKPIYLEANGDATHTGNNIGITASNQLKLKGSTVKIEGDLVNDQYEILLLGGRC
jgi:hypothetical protein